MAGEPLTVLSDDVATVESRGPDLSDEGLRSLYDAMLLCRRVEERAEALHRGGEIGFWVSAAGSEATTVGAAWALEDGDWLFPSYRDRGMFLLRGGSLQALFDQAFGNAADASRGRQLPGHPSLGGGRYVAPSGAVGSQILHAAGCGIAMRLRGDPHAVLACFGAGAADQGDFHTGVGLAAARRAPVVFLCQSRSQGPGSPDRPVVERSAGHEVDRTRVDGGDVLAVYQAVAEARAQAAAGGGPTLVEAVLSMLWGDGRGQDPLERLRVYLEERGIWTPAWEDERDGRARERIHAAVEQARGTGPPPPGSLFDDVWSVPPSGLRRQRDRLAGEDREATIRHGADGEAGAADGGAVADDGGTGTVVEEENR